MRNSFNETVSEMYGLVHQRLKTCGELVVV